MNATTQSKNTPLLKTKLFPPMFDEEQLLGRQPLIDRLCSQRMRRCLILSAPAGFGKSTALNLFRRHLLNLSENTVWLSCDESDSELQRMIQYVVAGIRERCPSFGENILKILADEVIQSSQDLLEKLLGDIKQLKGRWYLFLDDFHQLQNSSLHHGMQYLVKHLPEHFHIVLSSRTHLGFLSDDPDLSELVATFCGDEIRLSREESDRFLLDVKKLQMNSEELSLLYARTEGWIAALHLAALALQHTDDRAHLLAELSGTERNIADYLADDVLANLSEEEQQFIDKTSVLDEFNAELCNEVTDRTDAAEILQRLQNEQLLILRLDSEGKWLRYHHLFAEFLQSRLARYGDPDALLAKAARWCKEQDMIDHAIKYSIKAKDYEYAASLLEKQGAELIAGNRVYGILALIKQIPSEMIQSFAVFQIYYAWKLAFEHRYIEAEALIDELTMKLRQGAFKPQFAGLIQLAGAAQVLKALILFQQEKLQECIAMTEKWLSRIPESQLIFRATLGCLQAGAYCVAGNYQAAAEVLDRVHGNLDAIGSEYFHILVKMIETAICNERGDINEAFRLAEATRTHIHQIYGSHSRVGGSFIQTCAAIVYERNQADSILSELELSTTYKDVSTAPELLSRGWQVIIKANFFAGNTDIAFTQLDNWLVELEKPGYERPYIQVQCCKIQLLLWLKRFNDARRILRQLQIVIEALQNDQLEDCRITVVMAEARIALLDRQPDTVLAALESSIQASEGDFQQNRHIRLSLLLAVAYWQKGLLVKAFSLLQEIVEEGWARGYQRLFIDDAVWLLPMWNDWKSEAPEQASKWETLTELLNEQCRLLSVDTDSLNGDQGISRREREILRLVSIGLSNRDIAESVHLSEATVKWHLHNLFVKLGVKSRTQAVLKGKSLGVLIEG